MKPGKKKITSQTVTDLLIFAFFVWFVLSCLILPNINTLWSVFFQDGAFTLEPLQKLLGSERAMRSLRNSFVLLKESAPFEGALYKNAR